MGPHNAANQSEVFALLQDPRTYGLAGPVKRIDTHGAAVFLAGPDVYKVKRAVRFPFMDFSTLAKRHAACVAEIAVNENNAPGIYIGVMPVTRDAGVLRLGGDGPVVEWAVHLRRFDEDATLDHLAMQGPLGPALIDKLAQAVVAAHRRAPVKDGMAATRALRRLSTETIDELGETPELFPPDRAGVYGQRLMAAFEAAEPLLLRRGDRAQVRHCHGDLHLGNIVLIDGTPVLFDAIEFNDAIATSDILYDLAFLLMDLWKRGLCADANRLMNRYLATCDDAALQIEGLAAFPLFLSLRAAVRAKVMAALLRQGPGKPATRTEAQGYFDAAAGFLAPIAPVLIAVGGLSGTGKTTLAAAIAPALGRAPGAVHLRSDVERKRLFSIPETSRLPEDAYRPEISMKLHAKLHDLAMTALRAGQAVVMDATHQRREERAGLVALAAQASVPFIGLWLDAPTDILVQRVAGRHSDASDATAAVVASQAKRTVGVMEWARLDASLPADVLKSTALGIVRTARDGE